MNSDLLNEEVAQICNMCMATGVHKNVYDGETRLLSHMPVSFYPYELSSSTYQKLRAAHLIWVKLLVKVARDKEFVNRVFKETAESDEFVDRYLKIYNKFLEQ